MNQATTYEQDVKSAQEELDSRMESYWQNNENSDGGNPDDRYAILLRVARKFDVYESDLSN